MARTSDRARRCVWGKSLLPAAEHGVSSRPRARRGRLPPADHGRRSQLRATESDWDWRRPPPPPAPSCRTADQQGSEKYQLDNQVGNNKGVGIIFKLGSGPGTGALMPRQGPKPACSAFLLLLGFRPLYFENGLSAKNSILENMKKWTAGVPGTHWPHRFWQNPRAKYTPRLTGGLFFAPPPLSFFHDISEVANGSSLNFQYPPKHQFGTSWHKENSLSPIHRLQMTSEWRHIFPVKGRNKSLRETLSRKELKR